MQTLLFEPPSDWKPPKSINDLPRWASAKRIALDHEMRDDSLGSKLGPGWMREGGYMAGFGFMLEGDRPYYLPIRHLSGGNMNPEEVLRYAKGEAETFAGETLGANRNYDRLYEAKEAIWFPKAKANRNILNADAILWEWHYEYSLSAACKRHGVPGKDEEKLKEAAKAFGLHPKRDIWKFHSKYVGSYCEQDCAALFPLSDVIEKKLAELGLSYVWDEIETPFLDNCFDMTWRGIRVHPQRLEQIRDWTIEEEGKVLAIVESLTGRCIKVGDVWKAEQVAQALEAIGIKVPRAAKKKKVDDQGEDFIDEEELDASGKPSVDGTFLKNLKHPVADAIRRARAVNKIRTTYVKQTEDHWVPDTGGFYRIHPTYNQLASEKENGGVKGVRGARTSADHPSVQNQPVNFELNIPWRSIYYPEDGCEWAEADFSAQEWRKCIHFATTIKATGAKSFCDAWNADPTINPHRKMAAMTGLSYPYAKNCGFALMYGAGDAKICLFFLKLPTRWAIVRRRREAIYPGRYEGETFISATYEEALSAMEALQDETAEVREVAGEEAKRIIDTYREGAPFIGELNAYAKTRVYRTGRITLESGRRLNFPRDFKGKYMYVHAALNRLIQNSAADMSKEAGIRIRRQLPEIFIQVFVHDSYGGSFPLGSEGARQKKRIIEVMCDMKMLVSARAEMKNGPSWGECDKEAA